MRCAAMTHEELASLLGTYQYSTMRIPLHAVPHAIRMPTPDAYGSYVSVYLIYHGNTLLCGHNGHDYYPVMKELLIALRERPDMLRHRTYLDKLIVEAML